MRAMRSLKDDLDAYELYPEVSEALDDVLVAA